MKILHICLANYYADGHSYQENLLTKEHKKNGYEVDIIASTETFNNENIISYVKPQKYINEDGVHVLRLGYSNYLPFFYLKKKLRIYKGFKNELINSNPDIIFIHDVQFLSAYQLVDYIKERRKNGAVLKVIADCHADYSNSARNFFSYWLLHKLIYKKCAAKLNEVVDKFWGVLPQRVDFLKNMYGIRCSKISLLKMGADDDAIKMGDEPFIRDALRVKYNFDNKNKLIFTGGRIDEHKLETLDFIREFKCLQDLDARLVIIGTVCKNYLNEFNEAILSDHRIRYLGFLNSNEVNEVIIMSDIGVFLGRHSVMWEQCTGLGLPLIIKNEKLSIYLSHNNNIVNIKDVRAVLHYLDEIFKNGKINHLKNLAMSETRLIYSYKNIAIESLNLN